MRNLYLTYLLTHKATAVRPPPTHHDNYPS